MDKEIKRYLATSNKNYVRSLILTGTFLFSSLYISHDVLAAESKQSENPNLIKESVQVQTEKSDNKIVESNVTVPPIKNNNLSSEEIKDKPEGSQTLWDNPNGENYYRIPAIASTNDGEIIAVADYHYNDAWDLGNHRIDLLTKRSNDNGKTWSKEENITKDVSTSSVGYGDAAIVADRDSDNVVILSAYGNKGYWHKNPEFVSNRQDPLRVARLISTDGGKHFSKPQDITEKIYSLNDSWDRLFVASGRMIQSRYVKIGDYYRIYTSILEGHDGNQNYVLYSDDLGENWSILGDENSPVPNGDEAKIEELPNGNVAIFSRTAGGRFVNVFTYDKKDSNLSKGTWESNAEKINLGNGASTNGETFVTYAKNKETGKNVYLLLQSLPTLDNSRKGVGIYFKELLPTDKTALDLTKGWDENHFYLIQSKESAYSTMTLLKNGDIGFLYEDSIFNLGYDIQYITLSLEKITKGLYESAIPELNNIKQPLRIIDKENLTIDKTTSENKKVNKLNKLIINSEIVNKEVATEGNYNNQVYKVNLTENENHKTNLTQRTDSLVNKENHSKLLPKTGETRSNKVIISSIFIIFTGLYFMKKRRSKNQN